ncbi:hypothetical protein [Thalassospira mesophila]|uniref:Uncharacterized protein n=1 Tax=Thalassospira mesophila TaxID=1293891 RepID=A0A1Y2L1N0_9PROT|nr:hypothetical protein [Thalassospira mesophila]OSQ38864.1 hypothetical protein TMES_08910 [Thalassospira mesophila]
MIPQVPRAQTTNAAMHMSRLAPAGARGIATVNRDAGIEATNEQFGYQSDTDGTLFNAFLEEKNRHGTSHGGKDDNDARHHRKARTSTSNGPAMRDFSGDKASYDGARFADFLDFDGPLDLGARRSPQSIYAMVNAVTHGMPQRGEQLDFRV